MNIGTALKCAQHILSQSLLAQEDSTLRPSFESQILLAHTIQKDRIYLHTHAHAYLNNTHIRHFFESIQKRALGYPIEYLTQKVSFYSREFFITPHTLIPRPETELLVDKALEIIKTYNFHTIAEVGVGSGIISILLALHNPHITLYATDISPNAISCARINIAKFNVDSQITLVHSSLLDSIPTPQMLISNPPYIKNSYPLPLSVSYEPKEALFGGERGSEIIESLIMLCVKRNVRFLCCEIGYDQKATIHTFTRSMTYKSLDFYQDLSGFDRGFVLQFY